MARPRILQEGECYTFRNYFELPYEADEVLAELGYSLMKSRLTITRSITFGLLWSSSRPSANNLQA